MRKQPLLFLPSLAASRLPQINRILLFIKRLLRPGAGCRNRGFSSSCHHDLYVRTKQKRRFRMPSQGGQQAGCALRRGPGIGWKKRPRTMSKVAAAQQ